MIKIESPDNKNYKLFKSLATSKGLKKTEQCLIMGKGLTKELKSKHKDAKTIHFDEETSPDYLLSKSLFKDLSVIKTDEPILLMPFQKPCNYEESKSESFDIFLPVGDPKNLGALIRTSVAFNVDRIILLEESAHPFLPEAIRSSSGAVFKAPLFRGPSLKSLEIDNIYTLDKGGKSLYDWRPSSLKQVKILLGEEGGHLPKKYLENAISIHISDQVESLNVNSALSCTLSWLRSCIPL